MATVIGHRDQNGMTKPPKTIRSLSIDVGGALRWTKTDGTKVGAADMVREILPETMVRAGSVVDRRGPVETTIVGRARGKRVVISGTAAIWRCEARGRIAMTENVMGEGAKGVAPADAAVRRADLALSRHGAKSREKCPRMGLRRCAF